MRPLRSAAVLAAASLLLFGCSNASEGGGSEAAQGEAADIVEDEAAPEASANPQVDTGDRAVIYEAVLEVEDADADGVAEQAWDLAESFGGYVTDDERDRATGEEAAYSSAHLVLRVPSEQFTEAMDGLAALAESERYRSVTTEDVTEATVDLAAHIATKSASVERVRGLLAEAASVTAILELEAELAQREGELASLESQLEDLQDRVAMSTIDFTVITPAEAEEAEGYAGPDSFWDGVVVGFKGAVNLLVGVSVVIGVLLPFLPVAALVAAAVIVPIRLARKRRNAKAPTAGPLLPAAPPMPATPPRQ
ncbi:DUF4349 domain-containing protein [Glycomyces tritici]|uniref:DUF4349 domain-containing protein n=1 Tax=Glycomyces tritici TaxID=2665176 RepID=A0ABT7YVN7_9ACTN|nr:DUF4349 domain-containing protein [Glycomyces tritici]MDN3242670.1 DUF4349 domain-containing protein [Glycomyces tritici]